MDRDGWSGMFHECSFNNKYAFAITYLPLIVYNNLTIIKYNSIEERRNGTKGGSGLQHNKIIHNSHIQCHHHAC